MAKGHGPAAEKRPTGMSMAARLRTYLFAGILVTAPVTITLYLVWMVVGGIDALVTSLLPARVNPGDLLPVTIPGVGLLLVLAFLVLVGMFAAGFAGRLVVNAGENLLGRMPVVRGIYGATKQIFETVLAKQSNAFREVVLVEFPRRDAWTIAFITGTPQGEIQRVMEGDIVTVFVPTTPNPTGGYLLFVPRSDVVKLSMTVEEGIKMVVSGGIVAPPDRPPAVAVYEKVDA